MSEKSPSIAEIWNKHYATQEAFTRTMNGFRNQTLEEVEKIIDKINALGCQGHRDCDCMSNVYKIEQEIKNLKSQSPEITEATCKGSSASKDILCRCGHVLFEHEEKDKPTRCMYANGRGCKCPEFFKEDRKVGCGREVRFYDVLENETLTWKCGENKELELCESCKTKKVKE